MLKRLFSPSGSGAPERKTSPLGPGTLRALRVFSHLSHDEHLLLASNLTVVQLDGGEHLFRVGEDDNSDYFLLNGRLQITGMDGSERTLDGRSAKAQGVICALRPRQFDAVALEASSCLEIDRVVLADIIARAPDRTAPEPKELPGMNIDEAARLEASFYYDLEQNRVVVTSLPEVALKVRKVLEDPEFTADQVANVINTDPAIAAKLIKASNSPLYRSWEPCDTTTESVVRLGVTTTRQLVMSFTLKDLFKANTVVLRKAMQRAWRHTVYHAAIAWVMAGETGTFSPEEAMTAAMLSNIGVLTVCAYLENHPDLAQEAEAIEAAMMHLKAQAGSRILEKWALSPQIVECARHSDDWERVHEGPPDLCDLVIVAALHSHVGSRQLPRFEQVPAFQRLCSAQLLNPEKALDFLESAKVQVAEARALLEI